mgnify:FL=1
MNKGDFITARKNEDLYVRMMQHIPPPLGLVRVKLASPLRFVALHPQDVISLASKPTHQCSQSHKKWMFQRTLTTLRVVRALKLPAALSRSLPFVAMQRHPCRVAAVEIALSLVSAVLFVTDIVSDILVLVQLGRAGSEASAALAFGIIFMCVQSYLSETQAKR